VTATLLAIALVVVIAIILLRGVGLLSGGGFAFGGASAETRLLRVCQGNRDQVERLIRAELERNATLSRTEAADRALQRYQRDNR
jgi:hypothetical protein